MKKTPEQLADDFVAKQNQQLREGAEWRSERTIGEHVLALLRAGTEVNISSLLASLRGSSDTLLAEPAIKRLTDVSGGNE